MLIAQYSIVNTQYSILNTNLSKFTSYILYFFSLIAAYMLYWLFSLNSTITFISFLSYLAAILHFGVSSWLFFFRNKSGRVLSITTGLILMVWPIQVVVHSIFDKEYSLIAYYLLPVILSLITSTIHIANLIHPPLIGRIARVIMAVIPSVLFLCYVWYVTVESIKEGALNIVF